MIKLYDKFTELRNEKNSLIMMGLDPKDMSQVVKTYELSKIKNDLIGFKPNVQFYQLQGYRKYLTDISSNIGPKLIRLLDTKLPDGASTNNAAITAYSKEYEYVTIAPAGGCIEETLDKVRESNMEAISMGVMSFPGVLREIRSGYELFKERIDRAIDAETSGFVLGATAYVPATKFGETIDKYRKLKSDRPITDIEMNDIELEKALEMRNNLFRYVVNQMHKNPKLLALVPGFGRQGGNLEFFLDSGIDLNRCMINGGSDFFKAENPIKALAEMNATFNGYR